MILCIFEGPAHVARVARAVGLASRAWRQKGLGTLYLWLGRLPVMRGARCEVEFEPGCKFELDPVEPYWAPTVVGGRPYEPEMRHLLRRLAPLEPVLVDCGANFGYWSIVATGPDFGVRGAVAIEASPRTFDALARNAALNGNRFTCLHRAIAARSGETVTLEAESAHAVAHVGSSDGPGSRVTTVTVDDAVKAAGFADRERFLVKVDVEGLEVAAVEGAAKVCEADHAFVLEDWARRGYPTMQALQERGYQAYYVSLGGRCLAAGTPDQARSHAERDHHAGRAQNLVFVRGDGALTQVIRSWASEARA